MTPSISALVRDLGAIAGWKGCTLAQVALGWLLAQGQDIVPIPGTRSAHRVAENVAAAHLTFTPEGLDLIGSLQPHGAVGDRYPAPMLPTCNTGPATLPRCAQALA